MSISSFYAYDSTLSLTVNRLECVPKLVYNAWISFPEICVKWRKCKHYPLWHRIELPCMLCHLHAASQHSWTSFRSPSTEGFRIFCLFKESTFSCILFSYGKATL